MKLFEPGKVGRLEVENRIVFAPIGVNTFSRADGSLTQDGIDYYETIARGGTGLIVSGACSVSPELDQDRNINRTRADAINNDGKWIGRLANALHRHGTKLAIQIMTGLGRTALPRSLGIIGGPEAPMSGLLGPSAVPSFWDPRILTRALTIEEIEKYIEDVRRSAEGIANAGADAINIHGHSGYLEDMFMTSLWNKRTDKYGGSLENRLRYPLEIVSAIKKGAGADFPIIFRFSLTHYLPGGREIPEGLEIARRFEAAGVAALDVDAGCFETHYHVHPSAYSPGGPLLHISEMTKKVVSIPVMAVGKLQYPEVAERALQEGKTDFIMLGKQLLADPEWPNKVREGRPEDIRFCIGCFDCMEHNRRREYLSCAVRPQTGFEKAKAITPSEKKKSVLVIGGGPGGMEAARAAALRGHAVTLWEKDSALGGSLIPATAPDFKQDYRRLIKYLSTQLTKLGVAVELGKEATPERVREMKPDAVFVATGSTPTVPDIPGVKRENVVPALDLLSGKRKVGQTVVIIGGGLIGCEIGLWLAQGGKKVTVVARHEAASDMYWAPRYHLMKLLGDAGVRVLTNTSTLEIMDSGVLVSDKEEKRSTLEADTVVIAVGFEPNRRLLDKLNEAGDGLTEEIYAIGDCVEPRKVKEAIWEAFDKARTI